MDFLGEDLREYVESHTTAESDLLKKINRETFSKILMPQMLSGHLQGRVLSMLSKMIKPSKILEIGTFTGYSAICLAEGLAKEGKLITIDINEELEERVRGYFEEADLETIIDYRIGNALDIIPELDDKFELVFIDADKVNYSRYFDLVIEKILPGSHIIIDNVLWSGKVIDENVSDKDTVAIREFNDMVEKESKVDNVLLPIRDGLMILRKN